MPSDPSRQARNAALCGSAELTGLPVSGVGLDDPAGTDGEPKGAGFPELNNQEAASVFERFMNNINAKIYNSGKIKLIVNEIIS